jgi:DNA modification methylase
VHEFGLVEPLVWNVRTGNLVGGHQRLKVLVARGDTAAQVSVVDLPLEREKALNLALNKITGGWDQGKLATLLEDLTKTPDFDIGITGFDVPEIDSIIAAALGGDDRPESFDLQAELDRAAALGPPVTKPGDLILLGRDARTQHRLLCGDSTDPVQVRRLMAVTVIPIVGAGRDARAAGGMTRCATRMSMDAPLGVMLKPGTRASSRHAVGTTEAREAPTEAREASTEASRARRSVRREASRNARATDMHPSDARGTVAAARCAGTAGMPAGHAGSPCLRAALFATDPPYLVGYDGTNHPGTAASKARKSLNKDWSGTYCAGTDGTSWDDPDANPELYNQFVGVAIAEAIKPDAAFYCWHASKRQALVEAAWSKHGVLLHQQIIWAKTRPVLNRSWYTWQHEPCLFGWLQGHKPPRVERAVLSTVWTIEGLSRDERPDHPTPKPLELFEIPMRQHTQPGEICYEPFAGSGTQIIAAQRTGRRCFGLELSPVYCDVIVRRFMAYAGEQAVDPALAANYRVRDGARTGQNPGRRGRGTIGGGA